MLHEVVAELSGARRLAARPVRVDARVDAYVPAGYIASEALKIDLHRRLALVEDEDELRELEQATQDRYGPLPEPVSNLFAIQLAKLKVAQLGADYLVFRGGKASVGPVVMGSGELRALACRHRRVLDRPARGHVAGRGARRRDSARRSDDRGSICGVVG
jgi:transcription-repair coupling factor (superfamily II helicase)